MTTKKALLLGLLAMLGTLGFWLGGYAYFVSSDDWHHAKAMIAESGAVTSNVGQVRDMSVSPFGFTYRFSGQWTWVELRLLVHGDKGEVEFVAELEKSRGKWMLVRIEER